MAGRWVIRTEGMRGMENDFRRLGGKEPYRYAKQRMSAAAHEIFDQTQALVPVGSGDKRRPAGALRDSGRVETRSDGTNYWEAEIRYGTEDDELPYAVWARWKHHRKTGVDYMSPVDDPDDKIGEAMCAAWEDVFNGDVS